jgi:hypothetical protein
VFWQSARTGKQARPNVRTPTGGRLVAAVEGKSMVDLVASLTGGKLRFDLADLAALPRAALVVEDRYSQVFTQQRVRPALVANGLAELQVRWPPCRSCAPRPVSWPRSGPTARPLPDRGRQRHAEHRQVAERGAPIDPVCLA